MLTKGESDELCKTIHSQYKWFIINIRHSWLFQNLQITAFMNKPDPLATFELHILISVFEGGLKVGETASSARVKSNSRA